MKKTILFFLLILNVFNFCQAQEWMTSLDVAKRLALVQNKLIFAIWEDTTLKTYPVLIDDYNGKPLIVNLFDNESLNEIIWNHFVPVIISESNFPDLYDEIKDKRKESYILKFRDDSIKIMDVNGNILNTNSSGLSFELLDISSFIAKYSIDTSFLKPELISYSTGGNFFTSYYLAAKYVDFANFLEKEIRTEIIELSKIYLDEAKDHMESGDEQNKMISTQAIKLLRIKQNLVLNKPKKVLRQLRKINNSEIYSFNQSLFNFLHYTAFELLNDKKNANLWKNKVSLLDLKKAELLIKNSLQEF